MNESTNPSLEQKRNFSPTIYRGRLGQWAFVFHRVSGVLVLLFLLLHIVDVSLININKELYDDVHRLYGNVLLRVFEVGLLAALLFHAFNGLRVIILDFHPSLVRFQTKMLYVVIVLTTVLTILGGYVVLKPFLEKVM